MGEEITEKHCKVVKYPLVYLLVIDKENELRTIQISYFARYIGIRGPVHDRDFNVYGVLYLFNRRDDCYNWNFVCFTVY